jgi:hypothetical protein
MRLLFIYMTDTLEQIILEILQNRKDYVSYFKNNKLKIIEELEKIKKQLTDEI